MNWIAGIWQKPSQVSRSYFDGELAAFLASMCFHLSLLVALGLIPQFIAPRSEALTVISEPVDADDEPLKVPDEFHFSERLPDQVGAHSVHDSGAALSLAPVLSDVSEIPSPLDTVPVMDAPLEINHAVEAARGLHFDANLKVRGAAGQGVTGALGAIDRLTHEIMLSLEERKTLVVWLFDQSGSLHRQRQEIHDRLTRVYEELGVIEAAGNPAFKDMEDQPLLSSVVAFGDQITLRTKQPTDDVEQVKEAIRGIELDETGVERVFSAVFMAANKFKHLRVPQGGSQEPERNVMFVVFTDEAGEDQNGLEQTVALCRKFAMPVFVVGVPAPFGREETLVKWVDPDPEYDQRPQWGRVKQGPESLFPERVKIPFASQDESTDPIDSGFGPFALTRLCYETGGIYFTVHPNRNVNRTVRRGEVAPFSAHIAHFFDPEVMRDYRPDYVSIAEYQRRASQSATRAALLRTAQLGSVVPMQNPVLQFIKRDEATLAMALTEAQKQAAKLEPVIRAMFETIQLGEESRENEISPRWQAGFDLAMGRVAATLVRTESYNAMLAQAKRGMKFKDPKNNTWLLQPSGEISVGSQLARLGDKARSYLERVIQEHPGTPWALLAQRELEQPLGWVWTEKFIDLSPPPQLASNANNNPPPRPARNDQKRMIKRPPPLRKPPKL